MINRNTFATMFANNIHKVRNQYWFSKEFGFNLFLVLYLEYEKIAKLYAKFQKYIFINNKFVNNENIPMTIFL